MVAFSSIIKKVYKNVSKYKEARNDYTYVSRNSSKYSSATACTKQFAAAIFHRN